MSWVLLIIAGLLEALWLFAFAKSDALSNKFYAVFAMCAMAASLYLFAMSTKTIPISIAYLVWLSIGVFSISLIDHFLLGKVITAYQAFFLFLILIGVFGLKVTS